MDIYCKHCGEPWDVYELHEVYDENDNLLSHDKASKAFSKLGCGAFVYDMQFQKCNAKIVDSDRAEMAKILQEVSPHADDWIQY